MVSRDCGRKSALSFVTPNDNNVLSVIRCSCPAKVKFCISVSICLSIYLKSLTILTFREVHMGQKKDHQAFVHNPYQISIVFKARLWNGQCPTFPSLKKRAGTVHNPVLFCFVPQIFETNYCKSSVSIQTKSTYTYSKITIILATWHSVMTVF